MSRIRTTAAACALLALTGCGKKDDDAASPPPTVTASDALPTAATPVDAAAAPDAPGATAATPVDAAAAPAGDGDGDGDGDGEPSAPASKNSGPPRNLKVLPRSWSRKKVTAYMKATMNKSLGVKCKFCHDPDDYAADTEKKAVALDMMKMTNDVNKRFFKGKSEVTCMTCHLGHEEPPK